METDSISTKGDFSKKELTPLEQEVISLCNKYRVGDRLHGKLFPRLVSKLYDVPLEVIKSGRRTRSVVKARHIGMYLSKNHTSRSLPEIGRDFGGRHHTTVLHAVRKYEELRKYKKDIADELNALDRAINLGKRAIALPYR